MSAYASDLARFVDSARAQGATTLATMIGAKGGALVASGAQTISVDWASNFTKLGMEKIGPAVPYTIVIVLLVAVVA